MRMRTYEQGLEMRIETLRTKWVVLLIALTSLFATRSAAAQATDTEYCYAGLCYPSLSSAEQVMRAANPLYASYFAQKDRSVGLVGGALRTLSITYYVPDQAPASFNPPVYTFDPVSNPAPQYCAPSGDPTYPKSCASESTMIANLVASEIALNGATSATTSFSGSYVTPFSETHTVGTVNGIPYGWLRYNQDINTSLMKRVQITLNGVGPNFPKIELFGLRKFTSFPCPVGFTAKSGSHPSYNPNALTLATEPLCLPNVAEQSITTRLRQTSCPPEGCPTANPPVGPNPSYPATGDKARFETDFEFANRPFTRTYHSLRQAGQLPELAPGWVHAYSDRISGNPGFLSEPMLWTTDRGYLEVFKRVGSSNHFVSEGGASHTLDFEPTNTLSYKYMVTGRDTLVRYFNITGRLIRIEDRASAWKIEFTYQGDRLTTATDHMGRQLLFEYQGAYLAAIHLPDGNTVSYGYDTNSNLQSVLYPDATTKTYHYGEAGLADANDLHALTGITDNGQRFSTYAYDSAGRVRLSQLDTALGPVEKHVLTYTGDTQATVTGPNGDITSYTLSSTTGYRRVVSAAAPNGTTSNTYSGALAFETRDKLLNVTRYEYAADNAYANARYEAFGTPQERKTTTVRDAGYRITLRQVQQKSGASYVTMQSQAFVYNARGQVTATCLVDAGNSAASAYGCGSTATAPAGVRKVITTYCEQTDVDAGTCPLVGLVKSVDGARLSTDVADITTYTYRQSDPPGCVPGVNACSYRKGDLHFVTNALGQVTYVNSYDDAGRPLSMTDTNNVVTDLEYDARGRLTARKVRGTNPAAETDDQITRIEYWPNGLAKKVTQPDGAFTSFTYDNAHRLTGIADNAGNTITYFLNAASERTKEDTKDVGGVLLRTLSRTYDTLGQLQTATDALGRNTGFTYDANSNLDQTTDPLARVADNNYDPLNRLSRALQDMNGIAAETKFTYDALDNLTQVTDPKLLNTTYGYNGLSDLTSLQSPDTGTTVYTYDNAGNRKSQTDARGKLTNFAYDALNRLTGITYPTAATLNTTYAYDTDASGDCASFGEAFTVGKLVRMTDASGSTLFCYDRFGKLVRKRQTTNGLIFTTRYVFATSGRLQTVIYPDSAEARYVYDTQGRIKDISVRTATGTIVQLLANATYYPFGPVQQWTYGSAGGPRVMQRNFNQNYQPSFAQVNASGGISVGYEFDEVGNLKKLRAATQTDPPQRIYTYDGLNRLTENRNGSTNALLHGYAYDKTGNRTSATIGATTTAYTYPAGSHRLSQIGALAARSYDANGNTTAAPATTTKNFVYGDHNRMTQALNGTTVAMNYVYNGKGEQVRKFLGTTNTYSLYDDAGHWLADYANATTPAQQVIWMNDLPVGVLVGAGASQKLHYIEPDALGTPRVVVDPTRGTAGTAIWTWDLNGEAFGTTAPNQNPDGDATNFVFNMRFPGQRFDSASGLNYNYFRDYEAGTGRYVESDPIGQAGGIATFTYTEKGPLNEFDRLGLTSTIRDGIGPIEGIVLPIAERDGSMCKTCERVEAKCLLYWTLYDMGAARNPDIKSLPKACRNLCRADCVLRNSSDPHALINCALSCGSKCDRQVADFRDVVCREMKEFCQRNTGLGQKPGSPPTN
jgi:RHS repeat-associated protein